MRDGQWKVDAVLDSVQVGTANSGTEQVALVFELEDGTFLASYHFFTDASIAFTVKALETVGWDPVENNWDLPGLVATQSIKGAEVSLVLEEENYKGKTVTRVVFVNKRGGGGIAKERQHDVPGLAALAARLRSTSGSSTPKPVRAAQQLDDSDIPF